MADASLLERMGRELKCPICLSLLNSAVSLTCNHVFCNSCIVKSMKSVSNCPVCKVPYRRREVRPAPHMDNLVNAYKSMEVASGITIFVTQNAPSIKLSDEEKQVEGDRNRGVQETDGTCQDQAENKRKFKGKGSFITNLKNSGPNTAKPSFPAKKRVQVPQNPLSETLLRPENFEVGLGEGTKEGPKNSSIDLNEKPVLNENGEPVFSPFFWLREDEDEDPEKSTQLTDRDHVMDTPPLNVPSFSDIKDSDDEMPSKMTPKGEVQGKYNVAECLDSEMFEWTQRACSPELCSSPAKMQIGDTGEFDEIQEKELNEVSEGATTYGQEPRTKMGKSINLKQGNGVADFGLLSMPSHSTKNVNGYSETKKSNKRGRKASERAQKKCTKKNSNQVHEIHVDSKVVADTVEEQACDRNDNCPNFEKTANTTTKKAGSDLSVNAVPLNEGVNMVTELRAALGEKHGSAQDFKVKTKKSCDRINTQYQKDRSVRSKNRKQGFAEDNIVANVPIRKGQRNEVLNSELSLSSLPTVEDENVSDFGEKTSKHAREIESSSHPKHNRELRCSKKLKVSFEGVSDNKPAKDAQTGHMNTDAARETQSIKNCYPDFKGLDHASTMKKVPVSNEVLRKRETVPNKIQCAFCHSAEDSEASGEMVHYFNGRPVQADYNGGCNLIHSHRNCTEWAPNVYFEDETAINLEAELARSRRIKCGLCGAKGAALGCYEKSCRKSFHFPCVKLVPQCRWDTDNFVMLCPLHASSKLPNETSKPQGKGRKKCVPKGQSHGPQTQVAVKLDSISSWRRNSFGSARKLVLCCSALTVAERETVSEFERLSGVSVLKNWDLSVTHVIASTNENGACRRTLKILMGILEGKWILSIEWIKACMKAMEPVDEEQYEINVDIHGIKDGPRLGRLRLLNNQPKLFDGVKFYFTGDFVPSYKGYLQDLVTAAGGTVLHRKPISHEQGALSFGSSTSSTFIIYSLELPDKCDPSKKNTIFNRRRFDAEALSNLSGAKVASNLWLLNSIAACKLRSVME